MDSVHLHRQNLDNQLQHSALATDIPKMVETGQVRVVADDVTVRNKNKWISTTQRATYFSLLALTMAGLYTGPIHGATSGLFRMLGEARQLEFLASGYGTYRHVFTHLPALDAYLSSFGSFFEPLGSRQDDSSYLFWVWMIPQFGILWALLMMENLRGGPGKETYLRTIILGLGIQHFSLMAILPPYLLYLTRWGPLSRTTGPQALTIPLRITSRHLLILPVSIVLGYLVPSVVMMLPHPLITAHARQLYIVIWQFFPLYTVGIQAGLNAFAKWAEVASHGREKEDKLKSEEAKTVRYLYDARTVYLMAFTVAAVSHLNVLAICIFPEWLTAQFPFGRFVDVSFKSVFLPQAPTLGHRILGLLDGIHTFLHFDAYIGSLALIIYVANMARNAEKAGFRTYGDGTDARAKGEGEGRRLRFWVNMLAYTVLSGPVGAAVMGMWERDQRVVDQLVEEARKWKEEEKMIKSQ